MDPEIQEATGLLFARRLRTYRESLVHGHGSSGDQRESSMARGAHLASLGRALRAHCLRVLTDYVSLLDLFDALSDANGVRQSFERHVDDAASELCRMVGIHGKAEQNRVVNQASTIKSEADAELARAIERSRRARRYEAARKGDRAELDDRLPLGRRGAFDRELDRAAEEAERGAGALALVMMDLDHFKRVNDEHGHPIGDEVLLAVAHALVDRVAHKGKCYRYGGEEFALLLPSYSAEEACGLAERIRKDIEGSAVSSKALHVTASFGVASLPDHAVDTKSLLEEADAALYRAKTEGRNRVRTPEHLAT